VVSAFGIRKASKDLVGRVAPSAETVS
jgi:hypothetical protein